MAERASTLGFVRAPSGRTVVGCQRVVSPLALTRGFHLDDVPAGLCTVVLQSTTGALVPGDDVGLVVTAGPGAEAHVTTQGATVVHGDEGSARPAHTATTVVAAPGSFVELLPEPLILFPGARLHAELTIDLDDGAVVLAQEVVAGHDPGGGDGCFAELRSSVVVRRLGTVVATERLELRRGDDLGAPGLLGTARAVAGLWVVGAVPGDRLVAAVRAQVPGVAVALLPGDAGVLVRHLGRDGAEGRDAMHRAWCTVRSVLTGARPAPRRKGGVSG